VLPFRVGGADPALAHLREGLVELVSAGLTGVVGPEAVEAGRVLSAWKRANNGQEPSTQAVARSFARSLSAGQVLYSTVVGNTSRFTVTSTILGSGGGVLVPPVQVEGTSDSIPALVSALTTRLLGGSAGIPATVSNDAAAAYLAGMATYRTTKVSSAETEAQFARAIRLDSTFILATYRLVLMRVVYGPSQSVEPGAFRTLWTQRQRLSADQRRLLEAVADSNGNLFRTRALPRVERAATVLNDIAEVWDILGDLTFHVGAATGRDDWQERSRRALVRAVELDATLCPCAPEHLADFAFFNKDARAFARYTIGTPWQAYQGALIARDTGAIRAARNAYVREEIRMNWPFWLTGITLPVSEVDSILEQMRALANTEPQRRQLLRWTMDASMKAGRPDRADEARRQFFGADSASLILDHLSYAEHDGPASVRAALLLGTRYPLNTRSACEVGLSGLRRTDTTGVAAIIAAMPALDGERALVDAVTALPRGAPGLTTLCGQVMRGVLSAVLESGDSLLWRADSVMRLNPLNDGYDWNYDLALAFARRREYAAAAAASRRRWLAIGANNPFRLAIELRQEGKWAALAGDTAAAITAYEHYLLWRANPEPSMIPQRDSVRAELAALQPRRRR
jgi:hypothetical protein